MTAGAQVELELLRDHDVVRVIRMQDQPLHLGRDLTNTVVLLDRDVSGHHAVVSCGSQGLVVEDLKSTNGTFVNGVAIAGPCRVLDGDEIRLGARALLRVRTVTEARGLTLLVKDVRAGTAHVIEGERFRIGSAPDCDLRLPDGPRRAGTLIVHGNGEVWLGVGTDAVPLEPGDQFAVGADSFRLEAHEPGGSTTMRTREPAAYPYGLLVSLEGAGGVLARLEHLQDSRTYTVTAPNRASFLYVLARRLCDDRASERRSLECGWCDDEDVMVGVWGRSRARQTTSHYSVLLHRLRKELDEAGFDPWFIEKRRGATRLCLSTVHIAQHD